MTIIPRGQALDVTEQLPNEDQYDYDRAYLPARLDVTLGGRAAEEIALGDVTTGAENDLAERHWIVHQLLADARRQLDALADKLLEEETIERDTLTQVLSTRPQTGDESYNGVHTKKGK